MDLALIFYHAVSIYLSGIFDYYQSIYVRFNIPTPVLSRSDIDQHVELILESVNTALQHTNLSGILFLFPLRVAGARVTKRTDQQRVTDMLKMISSQGFVVSQAFMEDLDTVWETRNL